MHVSERIWTDTNTVPLHQRSVQSENNERMRIFLQNRINPRDGVCVARCFIYIYIYLYIGVLCDWPRSRSSHSNIAVLSVVFLFFFIKGRLNPPVCLFGGKAFSKREGWVLTLGTLYLFDLHVGNMRHLLLITRRKISVHSGYFIMKAVRVFHHGARAQHLLFSIIHPGLKKTRW